MWRGLWTLVLASLTASVTGFGSEGCYTGDSDLGYTETYIFRRFNTNADCVQQCANRGFILALTRDATCICSLVFPTTRVDIDGAAPCRTACAGSLAAIRYLPCEGDECCGGQYEGWAAYSVHATGGLDVLGQIKTRIHGALLYNDDLMTSLFRTTQTATSCTDEFEHVGSVHGHIRLQISPRQYRMHRNVMSIARCQQLCRRSGTSCRSFTYFMTSLVCTLNKVHSWEVPSVLQKQISYVYNRKCKLRIEVPDQQYTLALVNYERLFRLEAPSSVTPLDMYDFELDATNSNTQDTISRRVSETESVDAVYSTQSGFGSSVSATGTTDTSSTSSSSSSSSSSVRVGISASASLSASVGITGNNVKMSMSTETEAALQSGSSDTTDRDSTQSESKSDTKGESNFFNNGFSKTDRSQSEKEYEYFMTVPPLHRGTLRFLLQQEPVTIRWRAHFMLNEYIKLRVENQTVELDATRLLPYDDRSFYVMGSVQYDRYKVLGKTSIYDRAGRIVETQEQLLGQHAFSDNPRPDAPRPEIYTTPRPSKTHTRRPTHI